MNLLCAGLTAGWLLSRSSTVVPAVSKQDMVAGSGICCTEMCQVPRTATVCSSRLLHVSLAATVAAQHVSVHCGRHVAVHHPHSISTAHTAGSDSTWPEFRIDCCTPRITLARCFKARRAALFCFSSMLQVSFAAVSMQGMYMSSLEDTHSPNGINTAHTAVSQ